MYERHSRVRVVGAVAGVGQALRLPVQSGAAAPGDHRLRLHLQDQQRRRDQSAAENSRQSLGIVLGHRSDRLDHHVSDASSSSPARGLEDPQVHVLDRSVHPAARRDATLRIRLGFIGTESPHSRSHAESLREHRHASATNTRTNHDGRPRASRMAIQTARRQYGTLVQIEFQLRTRRTSDQRSVI